MNDKKDAPKKFSDVRKDVEEVLGQLKERAFNSQSLNRLIESASRLNEEGKELRNNFKRAAAKQIQKTGEKLNERARRLQSNEMVMRRLQAIKNPEEDIRHAMLFFENKLHKTAEKLGKYLDRFTAVAEDAKPRKDGAKKNSPSKKTDGEATHPARAVEEAISAVARKAANSSPARKVASALSHAQRILVESASQIPNHEKIGKVVERLQGAASRLAQQQVVLNRLQKYFRDLDNKSRKKADQLKNAIKTMETEVKQADQALKDEVSKEFPAAKKTIEPKEGKKPATEH